MAQRSGVWLPIGFASIGAIWVTCLFYAPVTEAQALVRPRGNALSVARRGVDNGLAQQREVVSRVFSFELPADDESPAASWADRARDALSNLAGGDPQSSLGALVNLSPIAEELRADLVDWAVASCRDIGQLGMVSAILARAAAADGDSPGSVRPAIDERLQAESRRIANLAYACFEETGDPRIGTVIRTLPVLAGTSLDPARHVDDLRLTYPDGQQSRFHTALLTRLRDTSDPAEATLFAQFCTSQPVAEVGRVISLLGQSRYFQIDESAEVVASWVLDAVAANSALDRSEPEAALGLRFVASIATSPYVPGDVLARVESLGPRFGALARFGEAIRAVLKGSAPDRGKTLHRYVTKALARDAVVLMRHRDWIRFFEQMLDTVAAEQPRVFDREFAVSLLQRRLGFAFPVFLRSLQVAGTLGAFELTDLQWLAGRVVASDLQENVRAACLAQVLDLASTHAADPADFDRFLSGFPRVDASQGIAVRGRLTRDRMRRKSVAEWVDLLASESASPLELAAAGGELRRALAESMPSPETLVQWVERGNVALTLLVLDAIANAPREADPRVLDVVLGPTVDPIQRSGIGDRYAFWRAVAKYSTVDEAESRLEFARSALARCEDWEFTDNEYRTRQGVEVLRLICDR